MSTFMQIKKPTLGLRFVERQTADGRVQRILQQLWLVEDGWHSTPRMYEEWRDVETVQDPNP